MPLFQSRPRLAACVGPLADWAARARRPSWCWAIEARGFILGGAIAQALGVGFAAARKRGKLPGRPHQPRLRARVRGGHARDPRRRRRPGQRVLVHDDLLATGGTARAACELVEELGGVVAGRGVRRRARPSCRAGTPCAGYDVRVTGHLRQRGTCRAMTTGLIGVDIGGSGIKAGAGGRAPRGADRASGSAWRRPQPAVARGRRRGDGRASSPRSARTPARWASACPRRSCDGGAMTAANIDPAWIGAAGRGAVHGGRRPPLRRPERRRRRRARRDALRRRARACRGVVLMLTLGTGHRRRPCSSTARWCRTPSSATSRSGARTPSCARRPGPASAAGCP